MQRIFQYVVLIALAGALLFTACTKDDGQGDADLAPLIYQDSLRVFPNPSWLYEDSVFYFAWEDFDGDMDNAIVTIRFEAQNGDVSFVDVDEIETEGDTGGSLKFTRNIVDGDEGRYFIDNPKQYPLKRAKLWAMKRAFGLYFKTKLKVK